MDIFAEGGRWLANAEIGSLEREVGRKAGAWGARGKLGCATALQRERDGLGGAVERQVARDLVASFDGLDGGADKVDRGILLGVEEVGAAKMIVAPGVVGVDALRLDVQLERVLGGIVGINGETAGEAVEAAVNAAQA